MFGDVDVNRTEKAEAVASLHQMLSSAALVVVTRQSGLTVSEVTDLRRKMRDAGVGYKVAKNRLTRLALEGTPFAKLGPMFVGPTAIAYSKDPVAAAKIAVEYAKDNEKLTIAGGSLGEQMLDVEGVRALASLPSLDELRAKLLAMINTPATRIAGVVQAPAGQLARVFGAYGSKEASGQAA
jgi:large subunit ribosomal protein L10